MENKIYSLCSLTLVIVQSQEGPSAGSVNSDVPDTSVCNISSVFITFKKKQLKHVFMLMKVCLKKPG